MQHPPMRAPPDERGGQCRWRRGACHHHVGVHTEQHCVQRIVLLGVLHTVQCASHRIEVVDHHDASVLVEGRSTETMQRPSHSFVLDGLHHHDRRVVGRRRPFAESSGQHVHVGVVALQRLRGECAQRAGDAAAGAAHHGHRPVVGSPPQCELALSVGVVDAADLSVLDLVVVEDRWQGRLPRWRTRVGAHPCGCVSDGLHHVGHVVDPRRLEHDMFVGSQSHHSPPGHTARQGGGDAVAHHVDRVRVVLQAQRDAQVGVGADVVTDHTLRPLRGQQQVHAQAAPALGHTHQRVQELRLLGHQRGELVDHHHQPRHRHMGCSSAQRREVGGVPLAQQCFSPSQLGMQAAQRSIRQLRIQVGDHAHHVRQRGQCIERGAALVVHQHELQMRRAAVRGEARHHRAQQFALAGAGGAGQQSVWTVALQVDVHHAIGGGADGGARCRVGAARCPPRGDGVGVGGAHHVVPLHAGGQSGHGERVLRVQPWGDGSHQSMRRLLAQTCGPYGLGQHRGGGVAYPSRHRPALHGQRRRAHRRHVVPVGQHGQQGGTAVCQCATHRAGARRHGVGVVGHEHHVRCVRAELLEHHG